ncbi:MAG: hypothetical protein JNL58_21140 [Planctomyces sp.]|nr:hypothetical protein [Planctomyces sp.]
MNATTELHLRQTASWCLHAVKVDDLATSTRTGAICPDLFANCDHIARLDAIHKTTGTLQVAIQQICERRAALIEELNLKLPTIDFCKAAGRLFGTDFDTDSCEAATDLSNGFFDLSDIPGWDTWFAYEPHNHIQGRAYCWVPNEIVAPVGRGIWAIPVDSVWWIDAMPDTAK